MNNSTPDVLEQVPAGGGMNKPASGTYGEKTELANLEAQLPSSGPAGGPESQAPRPVPTGSPGGGPGGGSSGPMGGMPRGLMSPTSQPGTPVGTPLAGVPQDPMAGAVEAQDRRVRYLQMLSSSPDATPDVKEWAKTVLEAISG